MLRGLLWTKKLKLHASIPVFTSALHLSHVANNSAHTGFHKPNLIYKPITTGKENKTNKKNPNNPKPSAHHVFEPSVWTLPSFCLAFATCHCASQLLCGHRELIPNTMQMSKSESNLSCKASPPIFLYNVSLLSYVPPYQWPFYATYHGLPLWFIFVPAFPKG